MTASPPPAADRIVGIDSLRGIAALAVFVCHLSQYWTFLDLPGKLPQVFALGAHGVDVFIVLSGFCLMLPVLASEGRLITTRFWGRRAFRILPPYWIALAFAAGLAIIPSTWPRVVAEPASLVDVALYAAGIQTWSASSIGAINGSLWSVAVEVQLYLLFPMLILVWRRTGIVPILIGAFAIAVVWAILGEMFPEAPFGIAVGHAFGVPARLVQFCIGMACAVWMLRRSQPPSRRVTAPVGLAVLLLAVGASTLQLPDPLKAVLWGAVGASLIVLVARSSVTARSTRTLEWFGRRSFSFYLLHQPITLLLGSTIALIPGGWVTQLLVGGAGCFVVVTLAALLLFHFAEEPSYRAGRRFVGTPTPRPVPVAAAEG